MYISIDFNSDEALYLQLRNQIVYAIVKAELREGENLPSVRDMAETVGINMHTVIGLRLLIFTFKQQLN